MNAVETVGGVLQGDKAGSSPREKRPEGGASTNFVSMPFFLYVFITLIVICHALAFAAWLFYFLKDLAANKTASVKLPSVKSAPVKRQKLYPDTLSGQSTTALKGGVSPHAISPESLRLRKPPVSTSAGSSASLKDANLQSQSGPSSSSSSREKTNNE
uniref:Putative transmembrane protein n=1 Tax=Toxoplasma gondii COUG TaxID=1074873 RepID=A0A2G8Y718_TOXGO|nr:putative transmembrane protein [Toxoplasma gondii COUG]